MNTGKTSLAQIMDFLSAMTFVRLIVCYGGRYPKLPTCTEQFRMRSRSRPSFTSCAL